MSDDTNIERGILVVGLIGFFIWLVSCTFDDEIVEEDVVIEQSVEEALEEATINLEQSVEEALEEATDVIDPNAHAKEMGELRKTNEVLRAKIDTLELQIRLIDAEDNKDDTIASNKKNRELEQTINEIKRENRIAFEKQHAEFVLKINRAEMEMEMLSIKVQTMHELLTEYGTEAVSATMEQ